MILAGIDEAGYGPVLGPLVVSATVFETDGGAETDLWARLSGAVTTAVSRRAGGPVAVADSKKVYHRKSARGIAPLERGTLAFLAAGGAGRDRRAVPTALVDVLGLLSPESARRAAGYAWYGSCGLPVPLKADVTDIECAANMIRVCMRENGIRLRRMRAETIFAGEFNRLVAATRNKAAVALDVTCRHLWRLWKAGGEKDMHITVDRQGGRIRYRETLMRIFPRAKLKICREDAGKSDYLLREGGRRVRVVFAAGAEMLSLPTALASMTSKYVRELMMEQFNRFWMSRIPNLKPTAGYYVDGNRFYEEIRPERERLNTPESSIYRRR